jgi:cell division protein FtsW (lipid II flippase)
VEQFFETVAGADTVLVDVYIGFMRWAAPVLALLILLRCCLPLLRFRREPEIWAWLYMGDGDRFAITHWENVIGRNKRCDVVVDFPTVSRNHAVLTRYDDGSWTVSDADSKSGIMVNGQRGKIFAIQEEDVISVGGVDLTFVPITARQEQRLAQLRTKAATFYDSTVNLCLLSLLQCLICMGLLMTARSSHGFQILLGFGGIMLCQWLLLGFYASIKRPSFEVETIAFFLCTMGMAAIATVIPADAVKQLISMVLGIGLFLAVGWSLRDLERAKKMRYVAAAAGVGLLVITLLFGDSHYGAKNWISVGPLSLQPSELSKVCFVFAGASTMDRLMDKRNLTLFIGYSVMVCGCLALMNDFGGALIFFVAFLVIAYLRSGSVGTLALAITALVLAGFVALQIAPHALRRFASWRHIWEMPLNQGYQQTRALMCIASGGLLGLGVGQGWMHHVFAADSDMVFATISEEWGLLLAVMMICAIMALAVFTVRSAIVGRSSFYTIGACTAAAILLMQVILNSLGTVDVVPLTGVTFPFVSNGGSSMMGMWALLAFVKAADTRQNGSFAVRLNAGRDENE